MATEDTDTGVPGALQRLFAKSASKGKASAPKGMPSLNELISTPVDQGLFANIVQCAEDGVTVAHPGAIEKDANELKARALSLRAQENFAGAQEVAELYKLKREGLNMIKSSVATLKMVIDFAEKELDKSDKQMEYEKSGLWKEVLDAAKSMLGPYTSVEEEKMKEARDAEQRAREQAAGSAPNPIQVDSGQEDMDEDDDLVPAEAKASNARPRKVKTVKGTTNSNSEKPKRRYNGTGSAKAKKAKKDFTEKDFNALISKPYTCNGNTYPNYKDHNSRQTTPSAERRAELEKNVLKAKRALASAEGALDDAIDSAGGRDKADFIAYGKAVVAPGREYYKNT